jgi:protein-disulfide isomerase
MNFSYLSELAFNFVKELNIPVTKTSIKLEFEKHPQQHSLLAINDVLNTFGINNAAYEIETKQLDNEFCPFIAHLSRNNGEFVIVKQLSADKVLVSGQTLKTEQLPRADFDAAYDGSILIADAEDASGEADYQQNRRKEIIESLKVPFIAASLLAASLLYVLQNQDRVSSLSWTVVIWGILKSIGLLISILLLVQSLDANNSFIQRLCTSGKNLNCNAILKSKAANVTEGLSWSEVGFFYFSSTTLILLFYGSSLSVLQSLALFNLLCLPYTFYSVYYQYKIAKQWCVFCSGIQALFWLEFFTSFHLLLLPVIWPSFTQIAGMLILFILPVAAWVFLKPFLKAKQEAESARQQLSIYKNNAELFNKVLVSQKQQVQPDDDFAIVLGNNEPKKVITIVSSPTCPPCSKAHQLLENWLNKDESLQLRVIFSVLPAEQESVKYKVIRHLLALKSAPGQMLKQAMHTWYGQKEENVESWIAKFPAPQEQEPDGILAKQQQWCDSVGINFTPTVFINGYKLPDPYHLEDIKYLI